MSNMMSMERWWNDTDRGKPKVLGENPVPVPLFPLQISKGVTADVSWGLRLKMLATNHLSHGTF